MRHLPLNIGESLILGSRSSAVAFHNGSAVLIDTVLASQEYKDLLQPILTQVTNLDPRRARPRCSVHGQYHQPREKSLWDFLPQYLKPFSKRNRRQSIPLHPKAELFQSQLLELAPFAQMPPDALSKVSVGITIPSWLLDSDETCHLASAALSTFGRVVCFETPPSSAYTATGYELCRISYEAFECDGPGRIMTLEYNNGLATASMVTTPVMSCFNDPVLFSLRNSTNSKDLAEWISAFIDRQRPDKLMLAGADTEDALFMEAIRDSDAVSYLDSHASLPANQVLAFGGAQAAKDKLESQIGDCEEWPECENLRIKADAIAGASMLSKPPIWPAIGLHHSQPLYEQPPQVEL